MAKVSFLGDIGNVSADYYTLKEFEESSKPSAIFVYDNVENKTSQMMDLSENVVHVLLSLGMPVMVMFVDNSRPQVNNVTDISLAINFLKGKRPNFSECIALGFGNLAVITLEIVMRRPEVILFGLISPIFPDNYSTISYLFPCPASGCIIQTSEEEPSTLKEHIHKTAKKFEITVLHTILEDSNKYFANKLQVFSDTLQNDIKKLYSRISMIKKVKK